ncbi:MAG: sigma-54 dependent transcriptional regulator [Nitrospirae bacterium]|nr:sigma-54 dependent transcriptional regulator [Nitrospirota bacterium]MCL5063011.1 sigma-54 dependent transcriptional regulator [Nitrospirota bacterium]MDA8214944.1 sigma-54 dependent transcriptional regulator [Nitrospiraceae bacterium]MDA8338718.1 sigma-54 dependent transcriptional regulator [Nitrospiraceae bacterium]
MKPKILIVDDEPDICKALEFLLKREGYAVTSVNSGEDAIENLKTESFDVIITDLKMGRVDGMTVLEKSKEINPDMPVIMMTAFASIESAVEAMKKGASDYIVKPFLNEEIKLTIKKVIEQKKIINENIALKQQISQRMACRDFVANSESMIKIIETLEKVIPTKSNILILGESGTGKGLIAELIHCNSPRRDKPFISINCSAIPEGLLESELFGYKKGAFTGAVSDKLGLIPLAHEGTLFLDEIGDMPPNLQAKLLKVLETGEVYPLGETKPKIVDVRIISATNVDIENRIKEGKFREDLYWRLNVIEIKIPPLRERKDDIEMLARHFIDKFSEEHKKNIKGIDTETLSSLIEYSWPGNVRELGNVIERAVVLTEGDYITQGNLPDKLKKTEHDIQSSTLKAYLGDYEKNLLIKLYEAHNKNKEETAKALGIDLATLYRKFKKYGIEE